MTRQNRTKLNQLLLAWPRGTVSVRTKLAKAKVSRQLTASYQKGFWLKRVGHGAFIRAEDTVDWLGAVYAIQQQLNLPIHPGGKTALQLQGYAHFVPMGKGHPVWLLGERGNKLPAWFKTYQWDVDVHYNTTKLFSHNKRLGLVKHDRDSFFVEISSPERAILEVLYFVPDDQSFTEAQLLMEGLITLRPKLVQELLENCNSIKVKRLFLFLAERYNHPWLKKVDLTKINLGQGKRMIVKDGKWDAKYQITVTSDPS